MNCSVCGKENEVLDPAFRRPDAVAAMPENLRKLRVKENDDLCEIRTGVDAEPSRCFVRCVLKVDVLDHPDPVSWGVWVEVGKDDFQHVLDEWSEPIQTTEPAMTAHLANSIPGYSETIGLQMSMRLTGPETRPELLIDHSINHPFANDVRQGVSHQRVQEWLDFAR